MFGKRPLFKYLLNRGKRFFLSKYCLSSIKTYFMMLLILKYTKNSQFQLCLEKGFH